MKALRHKEGFLFSVILMISLCSLPALSAAPKPATVAELALYKGDGRQQILEEGAKKEGKLTFYTTGILQQAVRPVVDAFQKKYPYIKVDIWRAASDVIIARLLEEYKAKQYLCDVIEADQATWLVLQKAGIAQPFYSPNFASIDEGALVKAKEGVFAAAFRESGIGLGFNTKQIAKEQVPRTYQGLLDPKWRGKVAIAGSNTGQKWMEAMLVAHGEEFVQKIAQQKFDIHMVSAAALLDMVINGEYLFSPTIYDAHVTNSKQKGAPVDWIPLEPVHLLAGQILMTNNTPHPHAAMLFIDFELSREGAEIHKKTGYNPTRKDVPGAVTYKKYYGVESIEELEKREELFKRLFLKR